MLQARGPRGSERTDFRQRQYQSPAAGMEEPTSPTEGQHQPLESPLAQSPARPSLGGVSVRPCTNTSRGSGPHHSQHVPEFMQTLPPCTQDTVEALQ